MPQPLLGILVPPEPGSRTLGRRARPAPGGRRRGTGPRPQARRAPGYARVSPTRSAAIRTAIAWRRNRSKRSVARPGGSKQVVGLDRGSAIRAPARRVSDSHRLGNAGGRPRGPLPLFAACITAIASAASASTASAISPVDVAGCSASRRTRPRASARAGMLEIASNAAARRRPRRPSGAPWSPYSTLLSFPVLIHSPSVMPSARRPPAPCAHHLHRQERRDCLAQACVRRGRSSASMRASVSSRPSAAIESKIPGDTVVPVIATRMRLVELLRLRAESLQQTRSAPPRSRRRLEGLALGQQGPRLAEERLRLGPSGTSPARLVVVDRRLEQEADQRPDLGQGLRLVLGDRAGRPEPLVIVRAPPERAGDPATASVYSSSGSSRMWRPFIQRSLRSSKIADACRPARRSARGAPRCSSASCRPRSPSRAARGSSEPPPAGSPRRAAPGPRRRRGASRASCRRAVQERQVGVARRLAPSASRTRSLLRRVREVVVAADHVGDPHLGVVHRDGEVVERGAVAAGDHEVVLRLVPGTDLAATASSSTRVTPSSGTRSRIAAPGSSRGSPR